MSKLLNWIRSHVPSWKHADDQRYFEQMLSLLRFTIADCHHPWYEENPWARGLRHGQVYRLGEIEEVGVDRLRFFRVTLQFDPEDFGEWERMVKEMPRDTWYEAMVTPIRWQWMIEELQREVTAAIPGTRQTLTREKLQKLKWVDGGPYA